MPNYKNGKVYKIVCNTTGKVYIGSTTVLLCKRLAGHVNKYKRGVYTSSKEILEGGNYSIVLIENVECDTKEQLLKKERYYIESTKCVNKRHPITSIEEKKEQAKEYKQLNKEAIAEYSNKYYKEYKQLNKEEIAEYQKEYHINNKEQIAERKKEYRQLNKTSIALKDKQRKKEYRLKSKQEKQQAIEQAIEELHIAVERVPV